MKNETVTPELVKGYLLSLVSGGSQEAGISVAKSNVKANNGVIYNLAGQKVGKDYKGIVIMNGKKMIQK